MKGTDGESGQNLKLLFYRSQTAIRAGPALPMTSDLIR